MERYTKKILEQEANYKEHIRILEDKIRNQQETIKVLLNQRVRSIDYEEYLEYKIRKELKEKDDVDQNNSEETICKN